jgi:uncharacterized protein
MSTRPTIAVIGAGSDRRKFGNKCVRAFVAAGYDVYPVHPKETTVEGLKAYPSIRDVPLDKLDRVSVYLPPAIGVKIMDDLTTKPTDLVWLNPGADGDEVVARAAVLGVNVQCACSIVAIGYSPNQFGDE